MFVSALVELVYPYGKPGFELDFHGTKPGFNVQGIRLKTKMTVEVIRF